ncbi:MAG: hypothetical protein JNK64_11355 [Myxococcales bacterium]|nr:hypothetical protein [Myxococcales bacterium]
MATDEPIDPPPPPAGDRDGLTESLRQRLETLVPDLVRRTVNAGMGAVFQTEDSLRRLSRELNVPNVAGYLGEAAEGTKEKVLEVVAREVREFLSHVNLSDEIAKMLTTLSLEVKTEVRFIPNSERYTGVEPDVKAAVRVKRAERERPVERPVEPEVPASSSRRESVSRLRRLWRRATEPVRDAIEDAIDGDDPPPGR